MNQYSTNQKKKKLLTANPLETIRDVGKSALGTIDQELIRPIASEFPKQFLGRRRSGELKPGQSVEVNPPSSKENENPSGKQLKVERTLLKEERALIERKTNELRLQIKAIQEEVKKLSKATPKLSRELEIASFQTLTDPSEYHLGFFQHIFNLIKKYQAQIQEAGTWMHTVNIRTKKKNVWGQKYKKYGAKYLLSGESYLQRSAG